MPTYEYECTNCDIIMQVKQSIKDKPLVVCPSCEQKTLKRLISGGNHFLFRGSGFYETDYKKKRNT